jgi:hypothetical protein
VEKVHQLYCLSLSQGCEVNSLGLVVEFELDREDLDVFCNPRFQLFPPGGRFDLRKNGSLEAAIDCGVGFEAARMGGWKLPKLLRKSRAS